MNVLTKVRNTTTATLRLVKGGRKRLEKLVNAVLLPREGCVAPPRISVAFRVDVDGDKGGRHMLSFLLLLRGVRGDDVG